MNYKNVLHVPVLIFRIFFHIFKSGFSGSDPDFCPIWTREKKFDPDPGKKPDPGASEDHYFFYQLTKSTNKRVKSYFGNFVKKF